MGRLNEGIFGGFSGRVGNVVGSTWKDIHYIRSRPAKYNDAKTKSQVKQRSKFSVAMEFLRTITPFIRVGFQSRANGRMTAFNAAMSYNMRSAMKGDHQGAEMDYPRVLVARGELSAATGVRVTAAKGELRATWIANQQRGTRSDDIVMLLAYNPLKGKAIYDLNAGKRGDSEAVLSLPLAWAGDEIETYLAFKTADGSEVSDSVYTGRHPVRFEQ